MKSSTRHLPRGPGHWSAAPRYARLAILLLTVLPLVALVGASAGYFSALWRLLQANLGPIASAQATLVLHHEVTIRNIAVEPGEVVLDGVAVSNRATWRAGRGEAVLRADRVVVQYSLLRLLENTKNASYALGDVDLYRPTVLIERYDNKHFNFSDFLLRPRKPTNKPFVGQVIAHNGALHFRDWQAPALLGERPAYNSLYDVNGAINFHSKRYAYFQGTGRGDGVRVTDLRIAGDASRMTAGRIRITGHATNGDAAYWTTYFHVFPEFSVTGGRADVDLTVERLASKPPPGAPVDLLGYVAVRNGSLTLTNPRFRKVPVRDVDGAATFTGTGATLRAVGTAARMPFSLSGSIFLFRNPQISFTGTAPRVALKRLAAVLPWLHVPPDLRMADATAAVQVTGSADDPVIAVSARSPRVVFMGNEGEDVAGSSLFAGGILSIPSLTFHLDGRGAGTAQALIDTRRTVPDVYVSGRVAGLPLGAVRVPGQSLGAMRLAGSTDLNFYAQQGRAPLSITSNISVNRLSIRDTAFRSASARVTWSPQRSLVVNRAVFVDTHGGVAVVSGDVPATSGGRWDMRANILGANVGELLAPYKLADISGMAYGQVRLQGSLSAPAVSGRAQLFSPRLGSISADAITGDFGFSKSRLHLDDVVVRRYPSALHVSGDVTRLATKNPHLNLTASVAGGDLQDLLSLAERVAAAPESPRTNRSHASATIARTLHTAASLPTLTGTVDGSVRIAGNLADPDVTGSAAITNGTVGAYRISSAHADLTYNEGRLRVTHATVQSDDGATGTLDGFWRPQTGAIQAAFGARNFDMDDADSLVSPYAVLDGHLDVNGEVSGTLASPDALVSISTRDLTVNGQSLAPLTIAGRYANGVITKTAAPWVAQIVPVTVSVTPAEVEPTRYNIDTFRVALPATPSGLASVEIDARIPADSPETVGHLIDTVQASRLASIPTVANALNWIDSLSASPSGRISVPSLVVSGPVNRLSVKGVVDVQKLAVENDTADRISANVAAVLGDSPSAHVAVAAEKLSLAGAPVDSVTASADYAGGTVRLATIDARSATGVFHAAGTADLKGMVKGDLEASGVPLQAFDGLLPPGHTVTGTITQVKLAVAGPTSAPNLTGSIALDHPNLVVRAVAHGPTAAPLETTHYVLDAVDVPSITVGPVAAGSAERVLTVTDLQVYANGKKNVATLSASVPVDSHNRPSFLTDALTARPLTSILSIDLAALASFAPEYLDPNAASGTLTANLSYGGPSSPLSGWIDVTDGSLGFVGPFINNNRVEIRPVDTRLQDINGQIRLDGNNLTVGALPDQPISATAPDGLTAKSNAGGMVVLTGGGTVVIPHGGGALKGTVALNLSARNFVVDEHTSKNLLAGFYNSAVRGTINGSLSIRGPWQSPTIRTAAPLVVSKASATIPSANDEEVAVKTVPLINPSFDITVDAGTAKDPVSLHNSLVSAKAYTTNKNAIHIGGTLSAPTLYGQLHIDRGQLILPTTIMQIQPPELVVARSGEVLPSPNTNLPPNTVAMRYPVQSTEPGENGVPTLAVTVNLSAVANITVSAAAKAAFATNREGPTGVNAETAPMPLTANNAAANGLTQTYTVAAQIDGTMNGDPKQLHLQFAAQGLQQDEIEASLIPTQALDAILNGGSGSGEAISNQLTEELASVVGPGILNGVESEVAGALGLSDLSLSYSPNTPPVLLVSKEIAPRLIVTYQQAIGARTAGAVNSVVDTPEYQVDLGYRITRQLQLSVSTDDQRNNTVALEGVFPVGF